MNDKVFPQTTLIDKRAPNLQAQCAPSGHDLIVSSTGGLTKRELFEMAAMQALLSNPAIMTREEFEGVYGKLHGAGALAIVASIHVERQLKNLQNLSEEDGPDA